MINGQDIAVPLIPAGPTKKRVRVDCPYCGQTRKLVTVYKVQTCGCGGKYFCEHEYKRPGVIYDRGFPCGAPGWWTDKGLVMIARTAEAERLAQEDART